MPPRNKLKPERTPYDVAVGLLARREHSRAELARKLTLRELDADAIVTALDKLESERLLSEGRFTEQFVRQRVERGHGPNKIRAALRQRGVADTLADAVLAEHAADWWRQVRDVRRKRFGHAFPDTFKERARQARFLNSRGFTAEQIGSVLNDEPTD